MIILDEIHHLLSETAAEFDRIFDIILEDPKKAILGLTVTLNEKDANIQLSWLLLQRYQQRIVQRKNDFVILR